MMKDSAPVVDPKGPWEVPLSSGGPSGAVTSGDFHPLEPNAANLAEMIERKDVEMLKQFGGVFAVISALNSDALHGLSPAAVESNREKFGENVLPPAEEVTLLGLVWEALSDPMMRLLLVAAIVSIVFGMTLESPDTGKVEREIGWIEGVAIIISITVVVCVSSINDYQKSKKFAELNAQTASKTVPVIRNGVQVSVDTADLVMGDVCCISAGVQLPADGIFIKGQDLKSDESAMTGETDTIKKNRDKDPFFISGTDIVEGMGTMVIVGIGETSFAGKLAMSTRGEGGDTPLQVKLTWLADMIGKIGLGGAILTFLVLAIKEIVKIADHKVTANASSFLNFLLVSVALVVVAVPEGLPLAVTIALAYSMKSMMDDNCLVRILAACETMGGANAICSDKTGTLTTNQMTVVQGWIAEDNFVLGGTGVQGFAGSAVTDSKEAKFKFHTIQKTVDLLCAALSVNSNAELSIDEHGNETWTQGNKTEHGMLNFVKRVGQDFSVLRNNATVRRTYPFSSAKKRMTTIVREGNHFTVFVKGAPELILEDCTSVVTRDGLIETITADMLSQLAHMINYIADQGNRAIAVAFAKTEALPDFPDEEPTPSLTMLAILGLQDPIRPEVPAAVEACRNAGITVRMVTGDNLHTAVAIARKCNLLSPNSNVEDGSVMDGRTFRAMAMKEPQKFLEMIPNLKVLARSTPTDKLLLVVSLMDAGDIVAVTGDGTNDAPALKLADVGFAMRSGTEVAQMASDIILMDDNFASVVKATIWGRTVNDNIRKFLQFQLTVNIAGVMLTMVGSAISDRNTEPLKPVQLLWLNLIMDTLAALALATERPTPECLKRSPISRAAPLISRRMWCFIMCHSCYQLACILLLVAYAHDWFSIGGCLADDSIKVFEENHWFELPAALLAAPTNVTLPGCIYQTINKGYVSCNAGIDRDCRCPATLYTKANCKDGLVHGTIIFNTFILFQLVNEVNARKLYGELNIFAGMGRSTMFFGVTVLCIGFQIIAVELLRQFMSTTPISILQWVGCIVIALTEIPLGFFVSLIPIKEWTPGPKSDPKKGLDETKVAEIRRIKESMGLIKSGDGTTAGEDSVGFTVPTAHSDGSSEENVSVGTRIVRFFTCWVCRKGRIVSPNDHSARSMQMNAMTGPPRMPSLPAIVRRPSSVSGRRNSARLSVGPGSTSARISPHPMTSPTTQPLRPH